MKDKPQSGGGINPVFAFLSINLQIKLKQLLGVGRDGQAPVSKGSHDDPGHPREGAARGHLVPIEGRSRQKYENRNGKPNSGEPITESPAHVVLDVNQHRVSKERPKKNAEHPPVEEGQLLGLLLRLELVELIGADRRYVGLRAAGAEGQCV